MLLHKDFKIGAIHKIIPTAKGDYCVASEQGIRFFQFDRYEKQDFIQTSEVLYEGQQVSLAVEYMPFKFLLANNKTPNFFSFDRLSNKITRIYDAEPMYDELARRDHYGEDSGLATG
jgi:hypothetical protein